MKPETINMVFLLVGFIMALAAIPIMNILYSKRKPDEDYIVASPKHSQQINEALGLVPVSFQLKKEVADKIIKEADKQGIILVAMIRQILEEHVSSGWTTITDDPTTLPKQEQFVLIDGSEFLLPALGYMTRFIDSELNTEVRWIKDGVVLPRNQNPEKWKNIGL